MTTSGDEPSFEDELSVLRSLTDQRTALPAKQVIAVADMTYPQRADLLTRVVDQAHAAAVIEDRRRRNGTG